ncbi:MAG: hypothetical protein H6Q60_1213 [Oscillospiraceae bacterium]|nr:hypothetical protein [Oscillospiraceae bacterium]
MNPCEMNVLITALTNYFYTSLSKEEFKCLSVFLNELSKSMFATILFQDVCNNNKLHPDKSTISSVFSTPQSASSIESTSSIESVSSILSSKNQKQPPKL